MKQLNYVFKLLMVMPFILAIGHTIQAQCPSTNFTQDTLKDITICEGNLSFDAYTEYTTYGEFVKADQNWIECNSVVPSLINTNRSVFVWMKKSTQVSGSHQFMVSMHKSGTGDVCLLGVGLNERLRMYDGNNGHTATTIITDGQWHFVGYTYNNVTNETKMYVDGILENTYTNAQQITATTDRIAIGQEFDGANPGQYYDGRLTEVSIWNEVLTGAEINLIMNRAIKNDHPKYANLQAYYLMDVDCSGDLMVLQDRSGNNNHGNASHNDIQSTTLMDEVTGFNAAGHYNVEWLKGGATISTAETLAFTATTADAGNYQLKLTKDYYTITDDWVLSLNPAPVITQQPIDQTVPLGGNATFTTTASSGAYDYQWNQINMGNQFVNRNYINNLGINGQGGCYGVYESDGTVYVATRSLLSISTNGGNSFTRHGPSNNCKGVYVSNGTIYLAMGQGISDGLGVSTDGGNTFVTKTTADGLGANFCTSVYESNYTIYVATNGGGLSISTDNGNTFITKTTADGLGSNTCSSVHESNGIIYVATEGGGLSISTDGGNTFTSKTTADGLVSNSCRDVYVSNGTIYVATATGLSISTDGGNTFSNKTMLNGLAYSECNAVYESNGTLYVATGAIFTLDGGLSISTDGGNTFISKTMANSGLIDNRCNDVYESNGIIYVATEGGLSILNGYEIMSGETGADLTVSNVGTTDAGRHFFLEVSDPVTGCIAYSDTVELCVTGPTTDVQTACGSFIWIDGNTYTSSNNTATYVLTTAEGCDYTVTLDLTINSIPQITQQPIDVVTSLGSDATFTTTTSGGPYDYQWYEEYTSTDFLNKTTTDGLAHNSCNGVYESNGTLYVATQDGLSISTDGGNTFTNKTNADGLAHNSCNSVYESNGTLYVATQGGLSISTDGGNTFINKTNADGLINNNCIGSYESNGVIYVATQVGLGISVDGGNSFWMRTALNGMVHNFCTGVYHSNGTIYVATQSGLSISTNGGNTFTNKTTADGLGNNYCTGVYGFGGTIYVTTWGGGLAMSTDGGNTFTSKNNSNSGLGTDYCYGMYKSNGTLYVAIFGGVSISIDGGSTFISKTVLDGIGSNDCFGVYESNGIIYLGTSGGLSVSPASTLMSGETGTDLTISSVVNDDLYRRFFLAVSDPLTGCTAYTNTVRICVTEATTDVQAACGSFTWIDGITYTSSNNTATHVLATAAGCDSIITLDLTINPIPVITQQPTNIATPLGTDVTFTSTTSGGAYAYQWYKVSDGSFINKTVSDGLISNTCNGVYESGGIIYVATDGGLSISTNGGNTFSNKTTAEGLGANLCNRVYESGGTIYVATDGGLSISTDGGNTFTNKTTTNGLGNNICKGVYESGGTIYVATYGGGLSISTDGGTTFSNKTTANGLGSDNCYGAYESGGTIYVATESGISISTDGGTTFTNNTLGWGACKAVYESNGVIYAAGNGLSISTDGGATYTQKTMADGLAYSTCEDVYVSNGTIYVPTFGGLSISTDGGNTFTTKTDADGLGSSSCSGVCESNGSVYVATGESWLPGGGLSMLIPGIIDGEIGTDLTFLNIDTSHTNQGYFLEVVDTVGGCSVYSDTVEIIEIINLVVGSVPNTMLTLDGVDDYVDISSVADKMAGSTNFTFESWIKVDPTQTGKNNIIVVNTSVSGNTVVALYIEDGLLKTDDGSNIRIYGAVDLRNTPTNGWHHVALTHNGSRVVVYLDGVEQGDFAGSVSVFTNAYVWSVGQGYNTGLASGFFKGNIDEVKIWNEVRTRQEIRETLHISVTGSEPNLVAYYQFDFDDAAGTIGGVKDIFGNIGQTIGGMTYTASEVAVGAGFANTQIVNSAGTYNFTNTELEITFSGTIPGDEVVVSKITIQNPFNETSGILLYNAGQYWVVNNYGTNTSLNANVKFKFPDGHITDPVAANYQIHKRGSREYQLTDWLNITVNSVSTATGDNHISINGITSFSQFAPAATNSSLPIELLSFTAKRASIEEVLLEWVTESETDNEGFEIERMLEHETEFQVIGFVEGNGTTVATTYYEFIDENSYPAVSYYRLKQIDFDGTTSYSDVKAVEGIGVHIPMEVAVYPNPVEDELKIRFNELPKNVETATIQVMTVNGQILDSFTSDVQAYQVLEVESVNRLTPSLYVLSIELEATSLRLHILKTNRL